MLYFSVATFKVLGILDKLHCHSPFCINVLASRHLTIGSFAYNRLHNKCRSSAVYYITNRNCGETRSVERKKKKRKHQTYNMTINSVLVITVTWTCPILELQALELWRTVSSRVWWRKCVTVSVPISRVSGQIQLVLHRSSWTSWGQLKLGGGPQSAVGWHGPAMVGSRPDAPQHSAISEAASPHTSALQLSLYETSWA